MGEATARPGLERWTALALLLPPLFMADVGPTSILQDDFLPHATGAGLAALASVPFALLLLFRRGTARSAGLLLFGLFLLALALLRSFGEPADTFEARRTLLAQGTAFALILGGASLAEDGRRIYARGVVVLSIAYLLGALADRANGFAGALGNTGSIAMAALPGAVAGAAFLGAERGPWRIAGGSAFGLFLAFVIRAPVIAGGLAACAGLAALAWRFRGRTRSLPIGLAALAALCALAPVLLRPSSPPGAPGAPPTGETGGFAVRTRVWSASLAMLRVHPLLGVGPGQFAAQFPPYRDPVEIELSSHGRASPVETEVDHPHEDWLAPALELGAPAGLLWIAFLLVVATGSLQAIRAGEPHRAALGAASVAALGYALVHAPLTHEPAAAAMIFVAFGAVLPRGPRFRPWPVLLVLVAAPAALAFVRHGRALAPLARPGEQDAQAVARSIDAALEACPDSSLARSLRARLLEESQADPARVADAWSAVLSLRPFRVEAIMQLAYANLRAGKLDLAREEYERARRLDPGHPGIRKNLRLLDLQEGSFDAGREWLAGADPSPEVCYARSKTERAGGDPLLADLFEARAHLLWARQHADAGRFGDAVRKYRQCLRVTREHVDGGAPRVRLELAAALVADGKVDAARAEYGELPAGAADWGSLPAWARAALQAAGWKVP